MKSIERIVKRLTAAANAGVWHGRDPDAYFNSCRYLDTRHGWSVLFTRDVGHHTSGWWKNPDYERCKHLSLSFFDAETRLPRPKDENITAAFIEAFFGHNKRWIWCEPPYSPDGKRMEVWHYRLFCTPGWTPLKPRGEVYGKELTEAGWLSFSDLQALKQSQADGGILLPAANNPNTES